MKRLIVFAFLFSSPLWGDELIMRDGSKMEWVGLKDKGDVYEVELSGGKGKVDVKKEDVVKFEKKALVVTEKPAEVLTGAVMAFDKKSKLEMVELFRGLDLKSAAKRGTWKAVPQGLSASMPSNHAALETAYVPPLEYDLSIVIRKKDGAGSGDGTGIGVVFGGKQVFISLDIFRNSKVWYGIWAGAKGPWDLKTGAEGKLIDDGKPHQFKVMVRTNGIVVQMDGKDVMTYSGDNSIFGDLPFYHPERKEVVFLNAASNSTVEFTNAFVMFPK